MWDSPNPVCSGYRRARNPGGKATGCEADLHRVVPRLRMSGATPPVAYSIYRYGMHGDNFISLKVMSSKVRLSVPSDIWNTCGADIDVKTVVCRGRRQSTSLQNTIVLLRRAAWHAVLLHSRGGSTLGRSGRRWLAVHVSFCHISHSRSRNWGKSRLIYFRTSG